MAQRNPRRSSILKSRNSVGIGDETKATELYSDEMTQNVTTNVGRRVSFSAKPQIREIPRVNVNEGSELEKTFVDYKDMTISMSLCETMTESPPEARENVLSDNSQKRDSTLVHELEKTLGYRDMSMSICETMAESPPPTRDREIVLSANSQKRESTLVQELEKTLGYRDMSMSICETMAESPPPTRDREIALSANSQKRESTLVQELEKTLGYRDMSMSMCEAITETPLTMRENVLPANSQRRESTPVQVQELEMTLGDRDMSMSICETMAESPPPASKDALLSVSANSQRSENPCVNEREDFEKTFIDYKDMSMSMSMYEAITETETPPTMRENVLSANSQKRETTEVSAGSEKSIPESSISETVAESSYSMRAYAEPKIIRASQIQLTTAVTYRTHHPNMANPMTLDLLRNPMGMNNVGRARAPPIAPRPQPVAQSHYGLFASTKTPVRFKGISAPIVPPKPSLVTAEVQTSPSLYHSLVPQVNSATVATNTSGVEIQLDTSVTKENTGLSVSANSQRRESTPVQELEKTLGDRDMSMSICETMAELPPPTRENVLSANSQKRERTPVQEFEKTLGDRDISMSIGETMAVSLPPASKNVLSANSQKSERTPVQELEKTLGGRDMSIGETMAESPPPTRENVLSTDSQKRESTSVQELEKTLGGRDMSMSICEIMAESPPPASKNARLSVSANSQREITEVRAGSGITIPESSMSETAEESSYSIRAYAEPQIIRASPQVQPINDTSMCEQGVEQATNITIVLSAGMQAQPPCNSRKSYTVSAAKILEDNDSAGIFETSIPHLSESTQSEGEEADNLDEIESSGLGPETRYYLNHFKELRGLNKLEAQDAVRDELLLLNKEEFERTLELLLKFVESGAFSKEYLKILDRKFKVAQFKKLPLIEQWKLNEGFKKEMDKKHPMKKVHGQPSAEMMKKIANFRVHSLKL